MKITQQQLDTLTRLCSAQTTLSLSVCAWDDGSGKQAELELTTRLTGSIRDGDLMAGQADLTEKMLKELGIPCSLFYLGESDLIATHACKYKILQ